jgi:FdhE protein
VPILHDQALELDVHFAADLFRRLVDALQPRPDLDRVAAAVLGGSLDPHSRVGEAFVQHRAHLAEFADAADVDAELLAMLATLATAPVLRAYAERLMPLVERLGDGVPEGAAWQRGYCPICGGWPLLAERRASELAQQLRCAACGAAWPSPRRRCPYCGNHDEGLAQTLVVDDEPRFTLSACERCRGYLKVVDVVDQLPAELLGLDDLATSGLDQVASEHGYARPAGAGYVIELAVADAEWVEELA